MGRPNASTSRAAHPPTPLHRPLIPAALPPHGMCSMVPPPCRRSHHRPGWAFFFLVSFSFFLSSTKSLSTAVKAFTLKRGSCLSVCLSRTAQRGSGRQLLQLGASLSNEDVKRIKDDTGYWQRLVCDSSSDTAKALLHIVPANGATFKLVLSVNGNAGHALRLHLLHRLHPDPEVRGNPDFLEHAPMSLRVELAQVALELRTAVAHYHVQFSNPTARLDPVSNLVRAVLLSDVGNKAHLLTRIGSALAAWRTSLRLELQTSSTSPPPATTSSSPPSPTSPTSPLVSSFIVHTSQYSA
jgi:hypothetical protein